ncbi:MAG: nucleotidyltransferase domain-containing protein [Armatimonadota bacterium]
MKVTWFDYSAVWEAVKRFAQELVEQFEEVEEVRVFGSLVRRECVPGSDVDVLILLRDHPLPFHERIPLFLPRHPMPVSVDVFPYTRQEVEKMLREGNHFLRQAMEEGIVVAGQDVMGLTNPRQTISIPVETSIRNGRT